MSQKLDPRRIKAPSSVINPNKDITRTIGYQTTLTEIREIAEIAALLNKNSSGYIRDLVKIDLAKQREIFKKNK